MIVELIITAFAQLVIWLGNLLPEWNPYGWVSQAFPQGFPNGIYHLIVAFGTGFATTSGVGLIIWILSWVRGMSK